MEIEFRRAILADCAGVCALVAELGYSANPDEVKTRIAQLLNEERNEVFVAVSSDRVVGWVHALRMSLIEAEERYEILGFVVAETHRRNGIGSRLLDLVRTIAVKRNVRLVSVRSNESRTESHGFYINLGFAHVKTQAVYRLKL